MRGAEVQGLRSTRTVTLALAMALVAVPATVAADAPAGHTGPFVGTVEDDETETHVYDNNPANQPCIELAVGYTVYLTHQLPGDTLRLTVDGEERLQDESSAGQAAVTFERGICAEFPIQVTGLDVDGQSAYEVTVCRGNTPALTDPGLLPLAPVCLGTVV